MPPNHEPLGCVEDLRYHLPAFLAAMVHTVVSTPTTNGECSVDPSVAQNTLRSSTRHRCQFLSCPPGFRPSPPVIVVNITLLGNHPLLCRATPPEKKNRRLRIRCSHIVSSGVPSYTRGWCSRHAIRAERQRPSGGLGGALCGTWRSGPHRESAYHIRTTESHPAFNMRTFRLIGAVFLSYNSGPNRLKHAHMRQIRCSNSSERSALSWIMPPRYRNWVVCLYLWPAASITSYGAVDL